MTVLPTPGPGLSLPERVRGLAALLGTEAFTDVCTDLLGGADRAAYTGQLRWLTGLTFAPGSPELDPTRWKDHWLRTWGARGLLHVWSDLAASAIRAGLDDPAWRPAEMCLKVTARHEVAGTGDAAARLAGHELPRVRVQALRALAVVGDTEHVVVVERCAEDLDGGVRLAAHRALATMSLRLDL